MKDNFLFLFGNDPNIYTIDLHSSENITQALAQLESGLFLGFKRKQNYCRIIYGVGKGVLKKEVMQVLKNNPMIKNFCEEEGGGSCICELFVNNI